MVSKAGKALFLLLKADLRNSVGFRSCERLYSNNEQIFANFLKLFLRQELIRKNWPQDSPENTV